MNADQPQAQTKSAKQRRRDRTRVRTSLPSNEKRNELRLPRPTRITDKYVSPTRGLKSGFETFDLEIGDATYRAITLAIKTTAAIAGVTKQVGAEHLVLAEKLGDYIGEVRLVVNGDNLQSLDMTELYTRNDFHKITFGPVHSGFAFPGGNMYESAAFEDAYALGTQGLRSLRLEAKIGADFDQETMELVVLPFVVDMPKPPGFVLKNERTNQTFSSVGVHTHHLDVYDDIKDVWLRGAGISHLKLEVDREVIFEMSRAQYEAYLLSEGRDPNPLNGEWFIDFHADGKPRSISALTLPGEIKRGAKMKLELTTMQENTPVEFLVTQADLYHKVR